MIGFDFNDDGVPFYFLKSLAKSKVYKQKKIGSPRKRNKKYQKGLKGISNS
jgi:hypothetical protein